MRWKTLPLCSALYLDLTTSSEARLVAWLYLASLHLVICRLTSSLSVSGTSCTVISLFRIPAGFRIRCTLNRRSDEISRLTREGEKKDKDQEAQGRRGNEQRTDRRRTSQTANRTDISSTRFPFFLTPFVNPSTRKRKWCHLGASKAGNKRANGDRFGETIDSEISKGCRHVEQNQSVSVDAKI